MPKSQPKSKKQKTNSVESSESNYEFLGIRIERETKLKLGRIAKAEHRALSMQAVIFIEAGVKHLEELATASDA